MAIAFKMMVKQARSLLIGDFFSKNRKEEADDASAEESRRVLEELVEKPSNWKPSISDCVPPIRRLLTTGDPNPNPNPQPLHTSDSSENQPRVFIRSRL